ncbi:nuclear transport factor 2 family protein [Nocardia crassostreae]|uniref:nuclear transport factor 2 family protein n=1 Tax=Nocardia crassostreae TaxID=53428 RepID=UPI00082BE358|nr:nuclear transport factor 2 family protein [Nocardia crassostreae]
MDIVQTAAQWAKEYESAWSAMDLDRMGQRYAADCLGQNPFQEVVHGRAARVANLAGIFPHIARYDVRFGTPYTRGHSSAVEYWVTSYGLDGSELTLAGVSLQEHTADGSATNVRDYLLLQPGIHTPPVTWYK